MSAIPEGTTHIEVTDNGANFWSITEPDDGTGEVWLGGKWMASEISDRLMQRLVSFTPLQRPEPWGPNDIIPLGEGSITGEAYRRGVEAGRRQVALAWTEDARNWGDALNEAGWKFIEVCPEQSVLLFNNCKQALREALMVYADKVAGSLQSAPIRVVADVSGGALHGVYAEVPVSVIFISDDSYDIEAQAEYLGDEEMRRDTSGNLIASWILASEGGDDAKTVHHYFEQVR